MTVSVTLDWHDAYMAGVSILLLISFRLAVRARHVATTDDRRSKRIMLWSGVLLFVGHAIFFGIGTLLSLEGFYLVNLGFMYNGAQVAFNMARGLRKPPVTAAPAGEPESSSQPADAPAEPLPPAPQQLLPTQRPAPTGSGPWPHPNREPGAAALAVEATQTESLMLKRAAVR